MHGAVARGCSLRQVRLQPPSRRTTAARARLLTPCYSLPATCYLLTCSLATCYLPQQHQRPIRLLLYGEQRAVLERGRCRHRLRKEVRQARGEVSSGSVSRGSAPCGSVCGGSSVYRGGMPRGSISRGSVRLSVPRLSVCRGSVPGGRCRLPLGEPRRCVAAITGDGIISRRRHGGGWQFYSLLREQSR